MKMNAKGEQTLSNNVVILLTANTSRAVIKKKASYSNPSSSDHGSQCHDKQLL